MNVGDRVFINCNSSFGVSSVGYDTITKITIQYNELTGVPYPVIHFGRHKFHGVTGKALNPPTAFYIEIEG